jgi:hypothetical protein
MSIDELLPLVKDAKGRCHSCQHQVRSDLPSGARFYCRSYGVEMTQEERDQVRNCPRWRPFKPYERSINKKTKKNPLVLEHIEEEDELFWNLKKHLDNIGGDLKTLLMLSQASIRSSEDVRWVDSLDDRFSDSKLKSLDETLTQLRALGYPSLCQLVDQIARRSGGKN